MNRDYILEKCGHHEAFRARKTNTIGIRQLKAELSQHLRRVQSGETIRKCLSRSSAAKPFAS
jgi:hypothetical protein